MECQRDTNLCNCYCTMECHQDFKGLCCECIKKHRSRNELPGCYFPSDVEKTFDRSIQAFIDNVVIPKEMRSRLDPKTGKFNHTGTDGPYDVNNPQTPIWQK